MRYCITTKATDFGPPDWRVRVLYALLFFVPRANPDSERLYPRVRKWLLELEEDGTPVREVAVDDGGRSLFRAPQGRNVGFWTDSDAKFTLEEFPEIPEDEFKSAWAEAGRGLQTY